MKTLLLVLSVLLLNGCATIMQPGPDRITVNSEPAGAMVYLNDSPVGMTPMTVSVNRPDDCRISVKKDGYQVFLTERNKVVAGWVFGNVILGGGIGLVVDLVTSHQGKYSEAPLFVKLSPEDRIPASSSK